MEKTCQNCAHYVQYYFINGKLLLKADCGHRRNSVSKPHKKTEEGTCGKWKEQPCEDLDITNLLKHMRKQLTELLLIVKSKQ